MKKIGIFLIVLGIIGSVLSFNMQTTVEAGGSYDYGFYTPKIKVDNIGLMDKRRNYIIASCFIGISGILFLGFGSINNSMKSQRLVECPYCAEKIQINAKNCRFCNMEIEPRYNKIPEEELIEAGRKTSKCEVCKSLFPSSEIEIYKGKTVCPDCYQQKTA